MFSLPMIYRDWKALGTSQGTDEQLPEKELPYSDALPTCSADILKYFSEVKVNV